MTNEIRLYGEEGIVQWSEIRSQLNEAEYNVLYGVIFNKQIFLFGRCIIVSNIYRDCNIVVHV